jgi:hypothetical protein
MHQTLQGMSLQPESGAALFSIGTTPIVCNCVNHPACLVTPA